MSVAAEALALSDDARIELILSDRWVSYPQGLAVLQRMEELLRGARRTRMPSLLVVGDPDMGKTTILRKFMRDRPASGGPFILSLQASEPIKGLEALQGRSVRSRRNVLSALAALLSQPARLEGEIAELLYWRTVPDHQGPYRTLVDHIGRDGRLRLEAALQHLPAAIALPAAAALADDADLGGRSLHKPLAFRGNYERGL